MTVLRKRADVRGSTEDGLLLSSQGGQDSNHALGTVGVTALLTDPVCASGEESQDDFVINEVPFADDLVDSRLTCLTDPGRSDDDFHATTVRHQDSVRYTSYKGYNSDSGSVQTQVPGTTSPHGWTETSIKASDSPPRSTL